MRLYDIPNEMRNVIDNMIDPDTGEISEELEGELDLLQGEFNRKAEYIALLAREAKAEAEMVKSEEDRLQKRRKAAENREARLKGYLHTCFINAGVQRVEGDLAKVRVQPNSQPSITWLRTPEELPEDMKRVTVALDGNAAKAAYKDGSLPEGFEVEYGSHLRIW